MLQIKSDSSAVTEQFGSDLGSRLCGGEVFVLSSDLGGGKTTLVRGMARGMGSSDHVASPTFTISKEYRADKLTLFHFDFYRLSEPGIIAAELAEYIDDPSAVLAIEWSGIVEDVLPKDRVEIHLERTGETSRNIRIQAPINRIYLFQENNA